MRNAGEGQQDPESFPGGLLVPVMMPTVISYLQSLGVTAGTLQSSFRVLFPGRLTVSLCQEDVT